MGRAKGQNVLCTSCKYLVHDARGPNSERCITKSAALLEDKFGESQKDHRLCMHSLLYHGTLHNYSVLCTARHCRLHNDNNLHRLRRCNTKRRCRSTRRLTLSRSFSYNQSKMSSARLFRPNSNSPSICHTMEYECLFHPLFLCRS